MKPRLGKAFRIGRGGVRFRRRRDASGIDIRRGRSHVVHRVSAGLLLACGAAKAARKVITIAVTSPSRRTLGSPTPSAPPNRPRRPPSLRYFPWTIQVLCCRWARWGKKRTRMHLSNELRKKNFSAFVYHRDGRPLLPRGSRPLHRSRAAVRESESDLEQEGYKPILQAVVAPINPSRYASFPPLDSMTPELETPRLLLRPITWPTHRKSSLFSRNGKSSGI